MDTTEYIFMIYILLLPYALLSGALLTDFFKLKLMILLYISSWFIIFYFINILGGGTSDQAIKMISVWLAMCIIIPGAIHQIVSIKFPLNYMTEYIDTNRDKSDEVFDLPYDTLRIELLNSFPYLQNTVYAADTSINKNIINKSLSGLINILNKDIVSKIENKNEKKNNFISSLNIVNPVAFFQNKLNSIAKTDYYAYKVFREEIQLKIDKQIKMILYDTWNKVKVDKAKYLQYVEHFK